MSDKTHSARRARRLLLVLPPLLVSVLVALLLLLPRSRPGTDRMDDMEIAGNLPSSASKKPVQPSDKVEDPSPEPCIPWEGEIPRPRLHWSAKSPADMLDNRPAERETPPVEGKVPDPFLLPPPVEEEGEAAPESDPEPGPKPPPPAPPVVKAPPSHLEWLAAHQHTDGFWRLDRYEEDSKRKQARRTYNASFQTAGVPHGDVAVDDDFRTGVSALALLACVNSGYDHKVGEYKVMIRRALMTLRALQDEEGCYGPQAAKGALLNHAMSLAALAETYGMTGDALLKGPAEKGAKFLIRARQTNGSWSDDIGEFSGNVRATAWAVYALKACVMAGIKVDEKAVEKAIEHGADWLANQVFGEGDKARTWYDVRNMFQPGIGPGTIFDDNPALDAMNITCQFLAGRWTREHPQAQLLLKRVLAHPPQWEQGKVDYEYWYWGAMAAFRFCDTSKPLHRSAEAIQLDPSAQWLATLGKVLTENQRGFSAADKGTTALTLAEHGSFDAVDPFSTKGGRVWSTAMGCLAQQAFFRYRRLAER